MWKAGVATMDVTPPVGVWLTGFAARTHPCTGIHDPLKVSALVLEDKQGGRAALVALDLIALTGEQVNRIRHLVREWTGIPPLNLLLNCSHTHSAPAIGGLAAPWMGIPDPNYLDLMVRKVATAVKVATERLRPARLRFGRSECHIGINRRQRTPQGQIVLGRNPQGVTDPYVDVLVVETPYGHPIAVAFAYACHPVVLGANNYLVTADFVGFSRSGLERLLDGATVLFFQGCAGNINPKRRGTFADAQSLGYELSSATFQAIVSADPIGESCIKGISRTLKLPLLPPPPPKDLRAHRKEMQARVKEAEKEGRIGEARWRRCEMEWAGRLLGVIRKNAVPSFEPMNVQVLQIGDVFFVAMASEPFSEIGLRLRREAPSPDRTIPLGYTNGCIGYLPTEKAYEEGGYEVTTAFKFYGRLLMHAPESERRVTQWLSRQLHRLSFSS